VTPFLGFSSLGVISFFKVDFMPGVGLYAYGTSLEGAFILLKSILNSYAFSLY